MSRAHRLALTAVCLGSLTWGLSLNARADDSAQALAAKALFTGSAESGAIARVGNSRIELSAMSFPCARCHGRGGGGGGEGVTRVPPITWDRLTASSSDRPAYDEQSFIVAIQQGVASDGRTLDRVMPRFKVAGPLINELITYLRELPALERRGVAAGAVQVQVLHDPGFEPLAADFRHGFDAAARQQKPWGRQIVIKSVPVTSAAQLTRQLSDESPFLIAGLAVRDHSFQQSVAASGLPVMTPLLRPETAGTEFWHDICLSPQETLNQLAIAASENHTAGGVAIVADLSQTMQSNQVARLTAAFGAAPDIRIVEAVAQVPVGWPAVLLSTQAVFSADEAVSLYGLAEQVGHQLTNALQAGNSFSLVDPCPPLPSFVSGNRASRAQSLGYVSGQIVAEAIRRSGRALTRSRFATALLQDPFVFSTFTIDYTRFPGQGVGVARLLRFRAQ